MWLLDEKEFPRRWSNIKALVFDWDGVFNAGLKSPVMPSGFFEADSMGVNMLRFSLWLRNGELPKVAVITGADNPGAQSWAQREHIDALYGKVLDKRAALEDFCKKNNCLPEEVAFFFDDILDLNAAAISGIRMLLNRPGATHFNNVVTENNWADYISNQTGGQYGLRECCDAILHASGYMTTVIEKRMKTNGDYTEYLQQRNTIEPNFY